MVAVMAPTNAKYVVREGKFGQGPEVKMGFIRHEDKDYPVHILTPDIPSYFKQRDFIMKEINLQFMPACHIGKLSEIPQKFLASADWTPVLFLRDSMAAPPIPLRTIVSDLNTKDKN